MRFGHRDERVGDRRKHPVEPPHTIRPPRAMQCGKYYWNADPSRRQPPPKHLVSGADRNHRIDLSIIQQPREPRPNAQVEFASQQIVVHRNFVGQNLAECSELL